MPSLDAALYGALVFPTSTGQQPRRLSNSSTPSETEATGRSKPSPPRSGEWHPRSDRAGTGTIGIFGAQICFDLHESFPLITTKKVFTRGIIAELPWILDGDTNEHTRRDKNVNIWKEWAKEDGSLGCGRSR